MAYKLIRNHTFKLVIVLKLDGKFKDKKLINDGKSFLNYVKLKQ